jgi:hypothetical protein
MKIVDEKEVKEMFRRVMKGEKLVHVVYDRKQPKCLVCGKRYDRENLPSGGECCGKVLSFITEDTCRFGVQNPGAGITKPGEGVRIGVSADEAFEQGLVKYYSFVREGDRTDGKKGGYRQFQLSNLVEFTVDKEKYLVNRKI